MYPVSDAFLQAIESNTRKYYWTGSIVTTNHITYDFSEKDIVKGSGYITRSACGSSEIELGSVYAGELGISLFSTIDRYTLEKAEIRLYFHLLLADGTEESVPMGVFEVSEANRSAKCLELKAYDYMLRFDKPLNMESSSGTPYHFLSTICNVCHVEMAQTQTEIKALPNGKETLGVYADNDIENFRDLLFYVAQVLGCVCQINRLGQLVLLPYGNTATREIKQKHRFDSSYSDFVTRYTAVSSTNKITEETEYYALEVDDGLTMNLGVNPLLQFGLKATREKLITNILNAIAIVEYVPFDSNTIGNPALDPMDCLTFSGGEADATKLSCITGITYKINGKHSLKCVGKNPLLANAKSKNDKNITGLLNQVEENKTVVYDFVNVTPYEIGSSPTEVLSITFVSKESTSAMFLAEVLLDITANDEYKTVTGTAIYEDTTAEQVEKSVAYTFTDKAHPILEVSYELNGSAIENFSPTAICHEGKHILTLFFPLSSVEANSENIFTMFLKMTGGRGAIGEMQIRATISGQGLVAALGDWNGKLTIEETVAPLLLNFRDMQLHLFIDNATLTQYDVTPVLPQDMVEPIHFVPYLSLKTLNDTVSVVGTDLWIPWTQPILSSATDYGTVSASTENQDRPPWKALDGIKNTAESCWESTSNATSGWFMWQLPMTLKILKVMLYNKYTGNTRLSKTVALYADENKTIPIGTTQVFPQYAYSEVSFVPSEPILTDCIYIDFIDSYNLMVGLSEIEIEALEPSLE